jgi:aryl-alcohol dehydrogenase-like predicted oxidoreductase
MVSIPGTSSLAHLEENVAAVRVALGAADIAELDAASGEVTAGR